MDFALFLKSNNKKMTKIFRSKTTEVIATLRPHHWIKNTFVYAPLIFSGRFTQIDMCFKATLAFISFCMASSAVYAFNDVCDRQEDRRHPIKKFRPIACGTISPGTAILVSVILFILSLTLACLLNWSLTLIVLIYFIINVAYSIFIKHIAILDVLTISAGFVLRIIGGGLSISVVPSYWLVLCTVMISIFLGFTKRRVELLAVNTDKNNSRPVLKDYSMSFLDQVIPIVTGTTILAYALYTVDEHTQMVLGTRAMLLTLPFVIYGLLRYIYIIYHLKQYADPTENLLRDIPTIINLTLWVVTSLLVVKYGEKLNFFR
jgi:4-hydroxybenzoate polyprenyltransferase